jgi:hypothetical protein
MERKQEAMIDLEPDYKKEYEELIKKLDFFAEMVTLVGVIGIFLFLVSIVVRNF